MSSVDKSCSCPVCFKVFTDREIEDHVNRCLFLNSEKEGSPTNKRYDNFPSPRTKRQKIPQPSTSNFEIHSDQHEVASTVGRPDSGQNTDNNIPLAERMRPKDLSSFVGQEHILGHAKALRTLLEKSDVPNMILWGPPGCGKTSLAHIIANQCKQNSNRYRFAKLSATMDGIDKVKEVVKIAKNELTSFKRRTLLFVDEIHRFNKLQQDVFLPHVESGVITLVGATTENPSFSLNNALLSRCCVYVMKKLETEDIMKIIQRALTVIGVAVAKAGKKEHRVDPLSWAVMDDQSILWMAELCDGDARIALNSVQLAHNILRQRKEENPGIVSLSLDEVKDCIKRSHILYDKKGDEHYTIISALHKSIRASDDNAALYWLTRMLAGGEDPIFIARRLVRAAGEDIGLADPSALPLAVSTMHGCQLLGMPECDVLLAECAVYLARAPKSTEVYKALGRAKSLINEQKGAQPAVPLHLRNAPTRLMKDLGYAKGYNMLHKDESNLQYMPEGLEDVNFF
ncbi:hypothetical protein R5R35_003149 [Gryllus longicercus]|uniref:AAA+ ATPase domain-containing protein n=1 Tax=Gryllus longicercus TaxID=2509291 RepID=A0AAN9Z3F5_9ORTH